MTSGGGTFSPEEIKYLKSLSAVAEATAKRITYTDDFKRYCVVHYNEGASPVRMFREAGLDPALIGYKRIERCLARWRESQDEILNSGNAKAGVENKLGGGASDSELFRSGAAGAPNIPESRASSESLARLGGIVTSGWYRQRIRFPRIARTSRHHLPRLPQRAEQ